ncbi:NUDIX hydrolase [Streptomyces sp. MUM 16J]|uniref:NUDIX hydrolase n=1 Tax=Streptomyces sp. MUM 16J TaxID=2791988 RepID=UPI001F0433BB|nr:NUDIX domain-containing protein [Streptomyces sp. MUM 16J]
MTASRDSRPGSSPASSGGSVELLPTRRIRLVEVAAPELSPRHRSAMDRCWSEAVRANPSLFDGPVAAITAVERDGSDGLVLRWVRATYRFRMLRHVPGAPVHRSLFVCVVQPTDDGRLLVGRMAPWTTHPGRWQLPGGTVEPPAGDERLDLAAVRRHAARELDEETGSGTSADALTLWLTVRHRRGGVGVLFTAPPLPARVVRERYAGVVEADTARGADPEFDRIELIHAPAGLSGLDGPHAAYLQPVLDHDTAPGTTGPPQRLRP